MLWWDFVEDILLLQESEKRCSIPYSMNSWKFYAYTYKNVFMNVSEDSYFLFQNKIKIIQLIILWINWRKVQWPYMHQRHLSLRRTQLFIFPSGCQISSTKSVLHIWRDVAFNMTVSFKTVSCHAPKSTGMPGCDRGHLDLRLTALRM